MRIVFMGTPDFAVPALERLIEMHEVVGVVTQPDKRKGRGKAMAYPPVKETALAHGIPVFQPVKVREDDFLRELRALAPEVIVVAAFGQILPESILALPKYGCINIHASLLPKYRGAAPIQWAVIDGEKETGVTTMYMAKGLDTGDMIDKIALPIAEDETGDSLHDKLALAGSELILTTLEKLLDGSAVRIPQDDSLSTYAKMLTKDLGEINWKRDACAIERMIRGLNSWPSAYTRLGDKTLKIWRADVVSEKEIPLPEEKVTAPGTIVMVKKDSFYVKTGKDYLKVREVQLQGKKRMPVQAFLLGYPLKEGICL